MVTVHTWTFNEGGPDHLVIHHDGDNSGNSIITVPPEALDPLPTTGVVQVQVPGRALAAFGRDQTLNAVVAAVEELIMTPEERGGAPGADARNRTLHAVLDAVETLRAHTAGQALPEEPPPAEPRARVRLGALVRCPWCGRSEVAVTRKGLASHPDGEIGRTGTSRCIGGGQTVFVGPAGQILPHPDAPPIDPIRTRP